MRKRKHWNYYEDNNEPSGRGGTAIIGIMIAILILVIYGIKIFIEWLKH